MKTNKKIILALCSLLILSGFLTPVLPVFSQDNTAGLSYLEELKAVIKSLEAQILAIQQAIKSFPLQASLTNPNPIPDSLENNSVVSDPILNSEEASSQKCAGKIICKNIYCACPINNSAFIIFEKNGEMITPEKIENSYEYSCPEKINCEEIYCSCQNAWGIRKSIMFLPRALKFGSNGNDVARLQEFLRQYSDIYPDGSVTGYFGRMTESALKKFQAKNNILKTGVIDIETLLNLNDIASEAIAP